MMQSLIESLKFLYFATRWLLLAFFLTGLFFLGYNLYLDFYFIYKLLNLFFGFVDYLEYFITVKLAQYPFPICLISTIYIKLYYIITNLMEASFQVDLGDVTTSYCFNLLLVYQDTNLFIILILSLVYYCLFRIIEEHLYNIYGDKITVSTFFYGQFRNFCLASIDNVYFIIEGFRGLNFTSSISFFEQFFPLSLIRYFDEEDLIDSPTFENLSFIKKIVPFFSFLYLKAFSCFLFGSPLGKKENFHYAATKNILRKDNDFQFINYFNSKFLKSSLGNENMLNFAEFSKIHKVPFFSKDMYYLAKIKSIHHIYQLFILADSKNILPYDLNKHNIFATNHLYLEIFDQNFLNFISSNFKNLRNKELKIFVRDNEILPNNRLISLVESNSAKNFFGYRKFYYDSKSLSRNDSFRSHYMKTYQYIFNRSSKYLSGGVPLNNSFLSSRLLKAVSLNSSDTLSFYDIFPIFISNIFGKNAKIKNSEDSSTYVMLSEPSTISFLAKLGSFNYCQYSLDNGPWYDVVLKAHELIHSFTFEYAWALFPSSIICYLMVPAYLLLYSLEFFGQAFLMVKVLGHQWFWSYEIENNVNNSTSVKFDSNITKNEEYNANLSSKKGLVYKLPAQEHARKVSKMPPSMFYEALANRLSIIHNRIIEIHYNISEKLIKKGNNLSEIVDLIKHFPITDTFSLPRLLATDKRLILPAEKPILLSICSTDVLHAFAVPNFGLKVDAVPGRINTFWLYMNKIGIYYGQCSELCGKGHGFMPVVVDSQPYSNQPLKLVTNYETPTNVHHVLNSILDMEFFAENFNNFPIREQVRVVYPNLQRGAPKDDFPWILEEDMYALYKSDELLRDLVKFDFGHKYKKYSGITEKTHYNTLANLKPSHQMLFDLGVRSHPIALYLADFLHDKKAACPPNGWCEGNSPKTIYWHNMSDKIKDLWLVFYYGFGNCLVGPLFNNHKPMDSMSIRSNFFAYGDRFLNLNTEILNLVTCTKEQIMVGEYPTRPNIEFIVNNNIDDLFLSLFKMTDFTLTGINLNPVVLYHTSEKIGLAKDDIQWVFDMYDNKWIDSKQCLEDAAVVRARIDELKAKILSEGHQIDPSHELILVDELPVRQWSDVLREKYDFGGFTPRNQNINPTLPQAQINFILNGGLDDYLKKYDNYVALYAQYCDFVEQQERFMRNQVVLENVFVGYLI